MQAASDANRRFFDDHPDPMWIYDRKTLRFLAVNDAAVAKYGWSREEFLAMSIADIRPPDDLPDLISSVEGLGPGGNEAGIWRHQSRSGRLIDVIVTSHATELAGRRAQMVAARDVTEVMAMERRARAVAEGAARHFEALFHAAPGKIVVVSPDDHVIVAVSDAYLRFAGARREDLLGRPLFDILPGADDAEGARELRDSFARVIATGREDILAVQRHAAPHGGDGRDRYWNVVNAPVLDAEGRVAHLIHRIEDITEVVGAGGPLAAAPPPPAANADPAMQLAWDILLRSQELQAANARLHEQEANLRTAQRLIGIGIWKLNLDSGRLDWSPNMHAMFGVPAGDFDGVRASYTALVHPEDRPGQVAVFEAFLRSGDVSYQFAHRILRPDGRVMHVKGAGEVTELLGARVLVGVVRDVTAEHEAQARLAEAVAMARLAGNLARLGSWRIEAASRRVFWSPVTLRIHGEAAGRQPTLEETFAFYEPEYREGVIATLERCLREGTPYDAIRAIRTRNGERVWVRVIGEAERDASGAIVAARGAFQDITELVSARDLSDHLARRLSRTLEDMSDAFFLLDDDWRFGFVNAEAERLLGRPRAELLGRNVWEAFPSSRGTVFQEEYERAVRTRVAARFSARYPAPPDRWFEVDAYPAPEGLAVYFRDVTQERARTEQLRILETAIARTDDVVMITEAVPAPGEVWPRVVFVNDAFERRTGYARAEAVGASSALLHGPCTQPEALERIRSAMARREPVRVEMIKHARSGEAFWMEVHSSPISDPDGRITHWVAIERDITERKAAQRALAVSEERFRLVTAASNDVIWDWDIAADVIWCNEMMEATFGHRAADIDGGRDGWRARLHPDDRAATFADLDAALASRADLWQAQYRYVRADGGYATVLDLARFIRDADGRAVRMVGKMTDVTRKLEERARRAQSRKLEAMGQLTGGVAHDFNNLLTVILGNAELLLASETKPSRRAMAEMTIAAAERGAALTGRLLAFARRQPLEPRSVDVGALIGPLQAMLRRTLPEDIDIECVAAAALWRAEADPDQLEAALLNLALNARDAMPGGGKLTIEAANACLDQAYAERHSEVTAGEFVQISVTDTGEGMRPEVAERAFEPFFTTKEEGKGSGLGLSMVYGFVKQSGGHVKIYSEPQEGTVFKLYLPRSRSDASAPEAALPADALAGGHERILVVEDDPHVRDNLMEQLRQLGYDATAARDGAEALAMLRARPDFDLLFTDVVMPGGMNGRQLADAARRFRPELPVLFTSGYTENAIVHHGRLDPGVELLSKPYRRAELAAKLRRALGG